MTWPKSSFSHSKDSVELSWRKSSFTSPNNCVEVAWPEVQVAVRDSKNTDGPILTFGRATFHRFTVGLFVDLGHRE
jgi:hypothetical protein